MLTPWEALEIGLVVSVNKNRMDSEDNFAEESLNVRAVGDAGCKKTMTNVVFKVLELSYTKPR